MKTVSISKASRTSRKGFTLVELLVALGITAVIVAMLVTITATALDGYSTSRNRVKASREAKAAFDQMSRDLESLVVRSGNNFEWLRVSSDQSAPGPTGNASPSAARAVFFTAATDRYDGQLNTAQDNGGDVSTVGYQLLYRDPVTNTDNDEFSSFILYRQLINPDETFANLLGQTDIQTAYQGFQASISSPDNFVCEGIYEFSLSFVVEYTVNGVTETERVLVLNAGGGNTVNDFRIRGNGISADGNTNTVYSNGRVVAADLSLTVINEQGLEILRTGNVAAATKQLVLERDCYFFAKTILLPQP